MTCFQRWSLLLIYLLVTTRNSGSVDTTPPTVQYSNNTAAAATASVTTPTISTTTTTTTSSTSTTSTSDITPEDNLTTIDPTPSPSSSSTTTSADSTVTSTAAPASATAIPTTSTTSPTTTTPPPTTTTTTETTSTTPSTTPAPITSSPKTESQTSVSVSSSTVDQTSQSTSDSSTTQPSSTNLPTTSVQTTEPPSSTPESSSSSSTGSSKVPTSSEGPATTDDTSTDSASGSTTVDMPTTTTTTPTTTTTTSAPQYPTQRPDKPFNLALPIGGTHEDAIYCQGNCTFSSISVEIEQAFGDVTGYLYIREANSATRRKRALQFTVDVLFEAASMQALNETARATQLNEALVSLNVTSTVLVVTDRANETIVIPFAKHASDQCTIQDACPPGYRCENSVCYHQCDGFDCGSNGVCNTVVNTDGNSEPQCVCDSNYDYTYSGDRCQDRQMSKKKVAAILGGVLGTFCAFLLIIIILLYCRLKGSGDSGRGKYQLGGYSNGAYAENEIGMKDVAENP